MKRCALPYVTIVAAFFVLPLAAHGDAHAAGKEYKLSGTIGFQEKPGSSIPLDASFIDEDAKPVRLREIVKGPVILSILYYRCPNACGTLLTGIAGTIRNYGAKSGEEPMLITMTIDDDETPADARKAKAIALAAIEKPYPPGKWRFLTGTASNIHAVTSAAGFRYIRQGDDFDHPLGLIILSPEGKVMRYLIGTDFLPMELKMSLMEASTGTIQPTIARMLRLCFTYDPHGKRFVFNMLRVSAVVIFSLIGLFVIFLIVTGTKRRKGVAHGR